MKTALMLVFVLGAVFGQRVPQNVVFDRILGHGYDHRERPPPYDRPTEISANVYLRYLRPTEKGFDVDLTFRQAWKDSRLRYPAEQGVPFISTNTRDRKVWTPDTFFQNSINVQHHSFPSLNEMIRIYPEGDVLLSQRLSMTLLCPLASKDPICNMDFASYGSTTQDIVYVWKNDTPVQLKDGLRRSTPYFELEKVNAEDCSSSTNTGTYSCLRIVLWFERYMTGGLSAKLYFIPILLVILSWLPFMLNTQLIIVRVLIGFFCLSTFILHWSIITDHLPNAANSAVGVDVFLTRCLGLIAATFIQLIVFVWITRVITARKERKLAKEKAIKIKGDEVTLIQTEPVQPEGRKLSTNLIIDLISLAIFILAFLVFVIHFVSYYSI